MKTVLNKACRKQIRSAKREHVESTLAKAKTHLPKSRWIGSQNYYATNTTERLPKGAEPLKEPSHLAQYIAASALLHAGDGWSYLGRAIRCLLDNDPHRAVHLAYYAELRAALSILAGQGIGVFKRHHFIIDGPNSSAKILQKENTHSFAWLAFNYWSKLQTSGALFSAVIAPGGLPISEWFGGVAGIESHLRPQAKYWFKQWSMDLRQIDFDHDARNESSYRPDGIPSSWYIEGSEALKVVDGVWSACEPSQSSTFENIDRHILRYSVHNAFKGIHGKSSLDDPIGFGGFVQGIVNKMGFSPAIDKLWFDFLSLQPEFNVPILFRYSQEQASNHAVGFAAIIARATFLLRLASGSSLRLMRGAGLTTGSTKFWWNELGVRRGFAKTEVDGSDMISLWDDLAPLLDDLRDFQLRTPAAEQTHFRIRSDLSEIMANLLTNERIALWSMTP